MTTPRPACSAAAAPRAPRGPAPESFVPNGPIDTAAFYFPAPRITLCYDGAGDYVGEGLAALRRNFALPRAAAPCAAPRSAAGRRGGVRAGGAADDFDAEPAGPGGELFSGRSPEGVTRAEQAGLAFLAPAPGELRGGGRLAGPVDAEEHDHVRLRKGGRRGGLAAQRAHDAFGRGFGG